MAYPIFPALSRAPAFKTNRKLGQDGTLSDPMESGYVTTRPRFTRLRRVFSVSYDLLQGEDVRALDRFETQIVRGGAGAFWLPSLVQNGSFELQGDAGSTFGWTPGDATLVAPSALASDGVTAMRFTGATTLTSQAQVPVSMGDALQVNAQVLASGLALSAAIQVVYGDGSTATLPLALAADSLLTLPSTAMVTAGYVGMTATAVVAASSTGAQTGVAQLVLSATGAGSLVVDEVGMAMVATLNPYGRMPGSSPTASLLRISGKEGISIPDAKWADGHKVYGATMEVTEV